MFSACLSYLSSHLEGEVSWDLTFAPFKQVSISSSFQGKLGGEGDVSQVSLSSVREVEECLPFEGCDSLESPNTVKSTGGSQQS